MPPDGRLVALDKDDRSMEVAKRYWQAAGVSHKVSCCSVSSHVSRYVSCHAV